MVELGFLVEPKKLDAFCSKVGGKPIFLREKIDAVICEFCDEECVFLLQLYAPDDQISEAYHRAVYIYICQCNNVKVFIQKASQDEKVEEHQTEIEQSQTKSEAKCETGNGAVSQSNGEFSEVESKISELPEFEIETFTEVIPEEELLDNQVRVLASQLDTDADEKYEARDKIFERFTNIIQLNPQQVIRYTLDEEYLPINKNEPVFHCDLCSKEMNVEFQIMPQMLNYLENVSDFGCIYVYSCFFGCASQEGKASVQYFDNEV